MFLRPPRVLIPFSLRVGRAWFSSESTIVPKDVIQLMQNDPKIISSFVQSLNGEKRRLLGLTASARELKQPHTLQDMDQDGDGSISRKEFASWYIIRGEVEDWLEKADAKSKKEGVKKPSPAPDIPKVEAKTSESGEVVVKQPSRQQLNRVWIRGMVPMIGFGFLNNSVMLIAGELIDQKFGLILGISTMAAAGLGNVVSDLAGYAFGKTLDHAASSLGLPDPNLTRAQRELRNVKYVHWLGGACGLLVGCVAGMCPLVISSYL